VGGADSVLEKAKSLSKEEKQEDKKDDKKAGAAA
jgi:hypothetical protein